MTDPRSANGVHATPQGIPGAKVVSANPHKPHNPATKSCASDSDLCTDVPMQGIDIAGNLQEGAVDLSIRATTNYRVVPKLVEPGVQNCANGAKPASSAAREQVQQRSLQDSQQRPSAKLPSSDRRVFPARGHNSRIDQGDSIRQKRVASGAEPYNLSGLYDMGDSELRGDYGRDRGGYNRKRRFRGAFPVIRGKGAAILFPGMRFASSTATWLILYRG